jgi:hypothetical protein
MLEDFFRQNIDHGAIDYAIPSGIASKILKNQILVFLSRLAPYGVRMMRLRLRWYRPHLGCPEFEFFVSGICLFQRHLKILETPLVGG